MYGDGYQGGGFRPQGGDFPPVNVGDEIDVKIEAVGEKGDGIARKRGFVLFVPKTQEGDEVRIRITKVLRKVGFAEVIGKAEGTPESSTPARAEEAPMPPPRAETAPEDSEDFGEEPEDEVPDEEAPEEESEEPAPEAEPEIPEAPEAPEAEPEEEEKTEE